MRNKDILIRAAKEGFYGMDIKLLERILAAQGPVTLVLLDLSREYGVHSAWIARRLKLLAERGYIRRGTRPNGRPSLAFEAIRDLDRADAAPKVESVEV